MSDDRTTALQVLNLDLDQVADITDRLEDDGLTQAAEVMDAMTTFAQSIDTVLDGGGAQLYSETLEMRRSHRAALTALVDIVRDRLGGILRNSAIGESMSNPEDADRLNESLRTLGDALTAIVEDLARVPARN
ncbi:hypothetical protein [Actinomadura sp. SCN-SB]|uniref:hypothetical protein n=1 Tax=Actinomadura sp. SCN-SB TaxID=3373092 RepID=UPI00375278DF